MTRTALSGVGAVLALAAALLLPAAVRGDEERPPLLTGFQLQASNGYELTVIAGAPSGEADEGWIGLFLVRSKREGVTYAAPATVTRTSIDADLGEVGEISITSVPTKGTRTVREDCGHGGTRTVNAERYEGTIEFHGEEGFADVSATAAPLEHPNPCGFGDEGGRPAGKSLPGARLDVERDRVEHYRFDFDAVQRRPGARTEVGAEVEENRGEIEIHRATSVMASAGALRFDRRLRTATVKPPAPFDGYGSFEGAPGRPGRWTGNLTVDLPGRANVELTGPGFRATLEHPHR